ncbi:uncharacterized protein [Macrobrachium rosenbergii]|uniref:uncharacterized protein n=1 Tax=Macrobrachium rosenbergii TaxID=79674 RepID=UPI0034D60486
MMSFIANAGAVPLGYVSDMAGNESQCHVCGGLCGLGSDVMSLHHLRSFYVFSPLPDIVLSNTPTSALQRAVSCPFVFSSRSNVAGNASKGLVTSYRVLTPRTGPKTGPRQCHSWCHVQRSLRNCSYQAVEQRRGNQPQMTQANRTQNTGSNSPGLCYPNSHCLQECHPNHLDLPQFIRQITHCSQLCRNEVSGWRSASLTSSENEMLENQILYCAVGKDLQKIADNFQLDHGKVMKKKKQVAALSLIFPEAFTRCLSASVLCLVWWRLLNKLR